MAQPPAGRIRSRRRFLVTVGGAAVTGLVAGDISYYSLAHRVVSAHDHDIVIRQLGKVAQMTGDPDFAAAAAQLRADHP